MLARWGAVLGSDIRIASMRGLQRERNVGLSAKTFIEKESSGSYSLHDDHMQVGAVEDYQSKSSV